MFSNVNAALVRFAGSLVREEGQAMAEYGLVIVLIAVALIAVVGSLTLALDGMFGDIIAAL